MLVTTPRGVVNLNISTNTLFQVYSVTYIILSCDENENHGILRGEPSRGIKLILGHTKLILSPARINYFGKGRRRCALI